MAFFVAIRYVRLIFDPPTNECIGFVNHVRRTLVNTFKKYLITIGLIFVTALALAHDASAATKTWNAAGGGLFSEGGNWTGGVPGPGDVAQFQSNTGTVAFNSDATTNSLWLLHLTSPGHFDVTFDLDGHEYSVGSAHLGYQIGCCHAVAADLSVKNGLLQVNGDMVTWFSSSLYVTDGGKVTVTDTLRTGIGNQLTSGVIEVSGAGSEMSVVGSASFGDSAYQNVTVSDQASLNTTFADFDGGGPSLITLFELTGSGSTWNNTGDTRISSYGSVLVTDGAIATIGGTTELGWDGFLTVESGSYTTAGLNLTISSGGDGVLSHTGGTLTVDGGVFTPVALHTTDGADAVPPPSFNSSTEPPRSLPPDISSETKITAPWKSPVARPWNRPA